MRIVADEDILAVEGSFRNLGELTTIPGRKIKRTDIVDADALLVRSITTVDEKLLHETTVKFVGSATAGTDHVDREYLLKKGIKFSHAEGSNANAVVEYCFTALATLTSSKNFDMTDKSVAIIGAGNVGGLFASKLAKLGFRCLVCDPFLSEEKGKEFEGLSCHVVNLEEALKADVVSLHVPLSITGQHPTFHLLNKSNLRNLPSGAVLLNTSRGPVIDNAALKQILIDRRDLTVVMDVWEAEPNLDIELLNLVDLASPHIAGYSAEAKLTATTKLATELCQFYSISDKQINETLSSVLNITSIKLGKHDAAIEDQYCSFILSRVLNLNSIDEIFRRQISLHEKGSAGIFDELRKALMKRHEFRCYEVDTAALDLKQCQLLSVLGFKLQEFQ